MIIQLFIKILNYKLQDIGDSETADYRELYFADEKEAAKQFVSTRLKRVLIFY